MKALMVSAVRALAVFTLLTGVIYPLAVTGIAQAIFPMQANGSLVEVDGEVIGSELIGQQTSDPAYFWWRPSPVTNFGSTSSTLDALVNERRSLGYTSDDLLFASGSGLDPHISPEAARSQVERVAAARDIDVDDIAELVEQFIEQPQFGILGEPRINVLLLNLALDTLK